MINVKDAVDNLAGLEYDLALRLVSLLGSHLKI